MKNFDIFISYRRQGGYDTAKHLNDLLVRDGYRVSFDIDTLRNGDFDVQLLNRIDQCEDFILIVDEKARDFKDGIDMAKEAILSGKAKEKQQKEKISEQISISIIPEIKRKLRETIPQIFNDYLKNTIETISQEFETQLEQKRQEIIVTQQDKEDNIKDIEQEILKLETIKKELQTLTTQNLYR